MSQTIKCLLCPHCINSDHPLESNGLSWLKCPLCGLSFRHGDLRGNTIVQGHLPKYLQEMLELNKEVDNQMNNVVQESTDNLFHEIQMTRIFRERAEKEEKIELRSELDKLFEVIFA